MEHHYRHKYKPTSTFSRWFPIIITASLLASLCIFIFWLATVALPIITVEASYQVKKTMVSVLGVSDIRALLIPTFRFSMAESTKYPDGSIIIPSIFMEEPVIYNVDPNNEPSYTEALKKGIAHASSTRLPDNGGLGYYFAHSSTPSVARQYNAVFYLLGKLNEGDDVYLWHDGKQSKYKVVQKEITSSGDVEFLQRSYDSETVVLQTCWPPGTSERRLLVYAERVLHDPGL